MHGYFRTRHKFKRIGGGGKVMNEKCQMKNEQSLLGKLTYELYI
jgi:hypothetical protein